MVSFTWFPLLHVVHNKIYINKLSVMCIIKSIRTQEHTHTHIYWEFSLLSAKGNETTNQGYTATAGKRQRKVKRQGTLTVSCSATEVITEQKERERGREKKTPAEQTSHTAD